MLAVIIPLAALSLIAIGAAVRALLTDGHRQVPTDPRRLP